jgi:hypothetical protein
MAGIAVLAEKAREKIDGASDTVSMAENVNDVLSESAVMSW